MFKVNNKGTRPTPLNSKYKSFSIFLMKYAAGVKAFPRSKLIFMFKNNTPWYSQRARKGCNPVGNYMFNIAIETLEQGVKYFQS